MPTSLRANRLLHLRLKQLVAVAAAGEIGLDFRRQGPRARQQPGGAGARESIFPTGIISTPTSASDIGTYIGEALKPRPPYQGATFFGVSRRRPSEDGSFAGVIQASVFSEYFENFYARIGREPGSYFTLGRTDGTVLARFPAIDSDIRLDPQRSDRAKDREQSRRPVSSP